MSMINFYCDPVVGDNRNSGSTDSATPIYVSSNGNWSNATHAFTPTDGTNPVAAGVAVGHYVAIMLNTATVTPWISLVTAVVNAVNGAITLHGAGAGAEPGVSSGNMMLRDGGSWKGPNAAVGFPFTLARLGNLVPNPSGGGTPIPYPDTTRVILKNNADYLITAGITVNGTQPMPVVVEGFDTGLGTRSIIDGGTNAIVALTSTGFSSQFFWRQLRFVSSATTGSNPLVSDGTSVWFNCAFHGARGHGLTTSGLVIECEAHDCNKANVTNTGGFASTGGSTATFIRCVSENHPTGTNRHGFAVSVVVKLFECIATNCGGHGILSSASGTQVLKNCDLYKNGRAGIGLTDGTGGLPSIMLIENCNFFKNAGGAVSLNNTQFQGNWPQGIMLNCAYGTGTMANGTDGIGNIQKIGTINYPAGQTPWVDPDHGDFRLAAGVPGLTAGRSYFTTYGYPQSTWIKFGGPTDYVTASAATDLWTTPFAHGLSADWAIYFYDVHDAFGSHIPLPLINATQYYVSPVGLTATQFKVCYTPGGTPVDLTTNSGAADVWLYYAPFDPNGLAFTGFPDVGAVQAYTIPVIVPAATLEEIWGIVGE